AVCAYGGNSVALHHNAATFLPPSDVDSGGLRMKVWAFDENRADFVDAAPERMNADATGYYIIRRGDDVLVREHGQERPMPERLTVAGVPFDREQFEHTHPLPLRAEMKRDGQWARAQLQARDRAEIALPLELPIWVTKTPLTEGKA
ncbi:MAG: hypothetical protein L0G50_11345, partial [Pseudomonas sp.]|nr:hypothetical protein [Pseudomonas sp.]